MDSAPLVTNSEDNVEDSGGEEERGNVGCCRKCFEVVKANNFKFILGFAFFLVLLATGIVVAVVTLEGNSDDTTSSPDPVTMTTSVMSTTDGTTTTTTSAPPGVCGGRCVLSWQCRKRSGNLDCFCSWGFFCGVSS